MSSLPPAAKEASTATVRAAIAKSQETPQPVDDSTDSPNGTPTLSIPVAPTWDLPAKRTWQLSSADTPTDAPTREAGLIDGEDVTVFNDATNFTVKHPLYSKWQLWFDSASKQDKAKSWDDALVKVIIRPLTHSYIQLSFLEPVQVIAFDSVEEFWGLYNNIVPPSLIHPNSNYYLFKEGVKPAWEDSANSKGGKWSVQLPRGKYSEAIDNYWLYTMLAAIGETFETPFTPTDSPSSDDALPASFNDEVTGVIVSARKAFYRINIWTRSAGTADELKIKNIGKHFKMGVLGLEDGLKISERDKVSSDVEFVSHKDSQSRSSKKPLFTV
ncbi:translation initiation factor 4E, partial [Phenoliferia sp. Uapishka_3]